MRAIRSRQPVVWRARRSCASAAKSILPTFTSRRELRSRRNLRESGGPCPGRPDYPPPGWWARCFHDRCARGGHSAGSSTLDPLALDSSKRSSPSPRVRSGAWPPIPAARVVRHSDRPGAGSRSKSRTVMKRGMPCLSTTGSSSRLRTPTSLCPDWYNRGLESLLSTDCGSVGLATQPVPLRALRGARNTLALAAEHYTSNAMLISEAHTLSPSARDIDTSAWGAQRVGADAHQLAPEKPPVSDKEPFSSLSLIQWGVVACMCEVWS